MSQLPASAPKTISDLIPYVLDALQNRTDVSDTLAAKYLKRAIQEVCESAPFEELMVTGPTVQLTIGQATYPVSFFLNPGDDYVQIPSFCIFVDFPNNTVINTLDYKTTKAIDIMSAPATQGLPSRWNRYGANIILGPNPNATYSMFCRYQVRHNFPQDENSLLAVKVHIPDTWEEIIAYAAAERIAIIKRWNDQATYLHSILYGDPENMTSEGKRGRPGLISARTMQIERDQQRSTRQLIPLVARYNPR